MEKSFVFPLFSQQTRKFIFEIFLTKLCVHSHFNKLYTQLWRMSILFINNFSMKYYLICLTFL